MTALRDLTTSPRLPLCALLLLAMAGTGTSAGGTPRQPTAGAQQAAISFWTDVPDGHAQVWVMNEDGSGRERLTDLYSAKRGDWSRDGQRLVFDGRFYATLNDFDIGVMNADGTGLRRITRGPAQDTMAAWSPDGRWIAFERQQDLWLVRSDGSGAHRLVKNGGSPDWSPNGRWIAFGGLGGLWVVRPDGTGRRRLTRGDDTDPRWSPNGRWLVFTGFHDEQADVYVVRTGGRERHRLTRNRLDDLAADWSPDGSRILFTRGPEEAHQVYVMNADGSNKVNLSHDRGNDWATSWR